MVFKGIGGFFPEMILALVYWSDDRPGKLLVVAHTSTISKKCENSMRMVLET